MKVACEENNMDETKSANRFSSRDWLTLALGIALALLWREVFSLNKMTYGLPALGAAVFTFAAWAAVLLVLGGRARWTRANIFTTVIALLLAVACAFQSDPLIRVGSFLIISALSVLSYLSLAGNSFYAITEPNALLEGLGSFFGGIFKNWDKPFRALASRDGSRRLNIGGVVLGALIAVPLLVLVISGLSEADAVFGAIFTGLFDSIFELDVAETVWDAASTLIFTLMFFSAFYFLLHEPKRTEGFVKMNPLPTSALITVLALLTAVCALFAAIQFKYLFAGESAAAMSGGWAEYARSGFYALVRVAFIVCVSALACSRASREGIAGRILTCALVLLAYVMLVSAAYRLYLYVIAYGLSVLRVMAMWAIVAIGVCLALVAVKALRDGFKFWPKAAACVLCLWTLFAFVNVGSLVSNYNVDAYLDGRLESVDAQYLHSLGPDSLDALYRLRESSRAPGMATPSLDELISSLENRETNDWTDIVIRFR